MRILCSILGHRWSEWERVPETMTIVSGCDRCPEVRTARFEAIIPASMLREMIENLARPNPLRPVNQMPGVHTAPSFVAPELPPADPELIG